jgi:membrane protease YdiL (CAAX protease family)
MERIAFLGNISIAGKIMLLLGLILICTLLTAFGGLLLGNLYLDVDIAELGGYISKPETNEAIAFTKFYQFLNQLGAFILPVLLFSFLVSQQPMSYLKLIERPKTIVFSVSFLIIFAILPFVNYLEDLNQGLALPEFLSNIEEWMSDKELHAAYLTEIIIKTDTFPGLLLNLFIVAFVPAIGEELLFRGILVRLMNDLTKNVHWAVIISALLFSAFHMQFYGFLPRFVLGLVLGYLFVFTRNLWVPIFVHFVNNAAAVIVFNLHHNGFIKVSMDDFGSVNNSIYIIGSLLITLWFMSIIYKKERFSFQ